MTFAMASLRKRANEHRRERGGPPRHLRHSIADFEAQIDAIEARLQDLAPERMSLQIQRRSGLT
jgi:hypothetical protein